MKQKRIKKILNYTKHDIKLITDKDKAPILIERNGIIRTGTQRRMREKIMYADGVLPVNDITFYGASYMIPEPEEGTIIVVSSLTASTMKEIRDDIYVVDELVKDGTGRIIGAKSLAKPAKVVKN